MADVTAVLLPGETSGLNTCRVLTQWMPALLRTRFRPRWQASGSMPTGQTLSGAWDLVGVHHHRGFKLKQTACG